MAVNIDPSNMQFDEGGFQYKGTYYPFADVVHLGLKRVQKTYYIGGAKESNKLGTEEASSLGIELNSGEVQQFLGKTNSPKEREAIDNAYSILSQATFESRVAFYIEGANKRGYFVYSGFKFYPSRQVISLEEREFTLSNTNFLRGYGYIELRSKNEGFLQKMKRETLGSKTVINTLWDSDVIFPLLAHFFGLRWN